MLIDDLVYECDERYRQNKDMCQCEYCQCESCTEENCSKCLKDIHYPNDESPQRTYDCENMADYYYCVYSYRYASEVIYGVKQFAEIRDKKVLKVMSVGCGPCTELAAIDYLHNKGILNYEKIEFRGIDPLNNMWKYIWEDIRNYYGEQVEFYESNVLDLVDIIVKRKWIPDLIIFQYVFSDMYKKNTEEKINEFIEKLANFLNNHTDQAIYILANDANLGKMYEGGRDFFDVLGSKIDEPKIIRRLHFDNNYKSTHYQYGEEYKNNNILFEIPDYIQEKYNPIDSCASAQVLIKKKIEKEEKE